MINIRKLAAVDIHARHYGVQQVIILVPLLVVVVALLQEARQRQKVK